MLNSDGVLNGASFQSQIPVAPGSLVTLKGARLADGTASAPGLPLSTELGGTEVILGGQSLPLLYTSDGQVNAQIPFNLNVNTQHQVVVRRMTNLSVPEDLTVAAAQPAIFANDASGKGQGVIMTSRGLADPAKPATAGENIVIQCTGLGKVDAPVAAGVAAPADLLAQVVNPVQVTIGGQPADVVLSALAPGRVGVYEVRAVVPRGVSGDALPVVITVAGQQSPPVTMAVR